MTRANKLWLAIFVLVVFATGALAGVLVDRRGRATGADTFAEGPEPAGARGRAPDGSDLAERNATRLERALNLTADQRTRVLDILQRRQIRLREFQEEARQRFVDEQRALQDEIAAVLTPDQLARFQTLRGRLLGPPRGRGPMGRGDLGGDNSGRRAGRGRE